MTSPDTEHWEELLDREAAEEALTDDERELLRRLGAEHPVYAAERVLLSELEADPTKTDAKGDRALVERVLLGVGSSAIIRTGRPRWSAWLVAGSVAAAAAVALVVATRPTEPTARMVQPAADSPVSVLLVEGGGRANEAPVRTGARLGQGAVIESNDGVVCLGLDPTIIACLGEGSRAVVSAALGPKRRIDLVSGSIAVALDPLPAGSRFSVVARDVWSTAIGTAFSVSIEPGGAVRTAVYEGKVLVGSESAGEIVQAHKIGLVAPGGIEVAPIERADRSRKWTALEELSGKRFEPPPPVEEPSAAAETEPVARVESPGGPSSEPVVRPSQKAEVLSAAAWLKQAREHRRAQRWADAAAAYRSLRAHYPGSDEARAVLVSLGQLELTELGQPARALESFNAYLSAGGPLAIEASLGKIRALRQLGRTAEEAEAIRAFLRQNPTSLQAAELEKRLESLSAE